MFFLADWDNYRGQYHPSLYPAAVHGDSVLTMAHPRTGTAGHRQDTPRGSSRTVRQSHLGAESRSFRFQTVPNWADVIPHHHAVPQHDSEAGGCTGTFPDRYKMTSVSIPEQLEKSILERSLAPSGKDFNLSSEIDNR